MAEIIQSSLYQEDIKSVLKLNCDWQKLKNKTLLITGASGLIGKVLVDMLDMLNSRFMLNMKLLLLFRNADETKNTDFIKYVKHDVSIPFSSDERIDYIIHAASNTHPLLYASQPIETISANVLGTYNLLSLAAKNKGCRFVFLSSVEIYGKGTKRFSENDCGYIDCNSLRAGYNESKRLGESLCQAFLAQKGIDFVTARLCRSYGPTVKSDDSKVISQFLRNALHGENIILKSEGNQLYSYIYASDASCAILFLMLNGQTGEAYNVSDASSDITLKDLAQIVAEYAGTSVVFDTPSAQEKAGFSKADTAVLNSEKITHLGWKAFVDIENGVKRCIRIMDSMMQQDRSCTVTNRSINYT